VPINVSCCWGNLDGGRNQLKFGKWYEW
jgi:hypothetical protein